MSSLASRMAARGRALCLDGNAQADGPKELEAAALPTAMSPLKLPNLDSSKCLFDHVPQEPFKSKFEPTDSLMRTSMATIPPKSGTELSDFLAPSPQKGRRSEVGSSVTSNAAGPVLKQGGNGHIRQRSRSRSAAADRPRTRASGVAYARTALFGSVKPANIPTGVSGQIAAQTNAESNFAQPVPAATGDCDDAEMAASAPALAPSAASSKAPTLASASLQATGSSHAPASATFSAILDDEDPSVREAASWGLNKIQELTSKKQKVYRHPRRESPRAKPTVSAEQVKATGAEPDAKRTCSHVGGEPREMSNGGRDPAPMPVLIPSDKKSPDVVAAVDTGENFRKSKTSKEEGKGATAKRGRKQAAHQAPQVSQDAAVEQTLKRQSADQSRAGSIKTSGQQEMRFVSNASKKRMLDEASSELCTGMRAAILHQHPTFDSLFMRVDPGAYNEDVNDGPGNWVYYVIECECKKLVCSLQTEGKKKELVRLDAGSEFVIPVGMKFTIENKSKFKQAQLLVMVLRLHAAS